MCSFLSFVYPVITHMWENDENYRFIGVLLIIILP